MIKKLFIFFFFMPASSALACNMVNPGYDSCLDFNIENIPDPQQENESSNLLSDKPQLNDAAINLELHGRIRSTVGKTSIETNIKK